VGDNEAANNDPITIPITMLGIMIFRFHALQSLR